MSKSTDDKAEKIVQNCLSALEALPLDLGDYQGWLRYLIEEARLSLDASG